MHKFLLISALAAGLSMTSHAFADDNNVNNVNKTELHEAGLGVSAGSYQGNNQGAVGIQGMHTVIQNGPGTTNAYGSGQWNIDLGLAPGQGGFALGFNEKSGTNLWNSPKRDGQTQVVPLFGLEPLNFAAGTSIGFSPAPGEGREQGHTPFFEWSPMAAAGVQVLGDSCKAMLALRGGASVGTLGTGGIRPAYGAGVSGVCKNLLQFDADVMHINGNNNISTDMVNARAFLEIPGQTFGIGVAFDGMDTKANNGNIYTLPTSNCPNAEVRGQAVVGGVF